MIRPSNEARCTARYRPPGIASIHTEYRGDRVTAHCSNPTCDAIVTRPRSQMPKSPFCSRTCLAQYRG